MWILQLVWFSYRLIITAPPNKISQYIFWITCCSRRKTTWPSVKTNTLIDQGISQPGERSWHKSDTLIGTELGIFTKNIDIIVCFKKYTPWSRAIQQTTVLKKYKNITAERVNLAVNNAATCTFGAQKKSSRKSRWKILTKQTIATKDACFVYMMSHNAVKKWGV